MISNQLISMDKMVMTLPLPLANLDKPWKNDREQRGGGLEKHTTPDGTIGMPHNTPIISF